MEERFSDNGYGRASNYLDVINKGCQNNFFKTIKRHGRFYAEFHEQTRTSKSVYTRNTTICKSQSALVFNNLQMRYSSWRHCVYHSVCIMV